MTEALSLLATRLFRETYASALPAEDVEEYVEISFHPEVLRRSLMDASSTILVAQDGRHFIAYAQLRWAEPPIPCPFQIELQRFYVASSHHASGLAQRLMAACFEWVRNRGFEGLWLQAWERSHRALRFYEKEGFTEAGETSFDVAGTLYRDRVLIRSLSSQCAGTEA